MQLEWAKTRDGGWWSFERVEPAQLGPYGVFVVWRNGSEAGAPTVLYVGRGSLKDEIARCRRDPLFRSQSLYVTWAAVEEPRMLDAIAAYLYRELRPLWGEVVPMVPPRPVNVPLPA